MDGGLHKKGVYHKSGANILLTENPKLNVMKEIFYGYYHLCR